MKNSYANTTHPTTHLGFTIVELLIVIVVIGILAAISVVAYTGITNGANDAAVKSDLRNFGTLVEEYNINEGDFPAGGSSSGPVGLGVIDIAIDSYYAGSELNNLYYCAGTSAANGAPMAAIVAISKSGNKFAYSSERGIYNYSGVYNNSNIGICGALGLAGGHTYSLARNATENRWRNWVK